MTAMLKNTISYPMADKIRCIGASRQRRGRPNLTGIFVAQIDSLARRVTDWVIMPGSKFVLAAIDCPRAAHACFRNKESELRVGDHIGPWCRSPLATLQMDHIFASIAGKATQPIVKKQVRGALQWRRSTYIRMCR